MIRYFLFLFISILIQLFSIPVLNGVGYWLGTFVHEPYQLQGGNGMDFYGFTLYFMTLILVVCISAITALRILIKSEWLASLLHITLILFLWYFTIGDLHYRPYEHLLLMICVSLTLPIRWIIRKVLWKRMVENWDNFFNK